MRAAGDGFTTWEQRESGRIWRDLQDGDGYNEMRWKRGPSKEGEAVNKMWEPNGDTGSRPVEGHVRPAELDLDERLVVVLVIELIEFGPARG
jgi:hypothetical protein